MIPRTSYKGIRRYALELAKSTGTVATADLAQKFGLSIMQASSNMYRMKVLGLIEPVERAAAGKLIYAITDQGVAYLGGEIVDRVPIFDCSALCAAMGYESHSITVPLGE